MQLCKYEYVHINGILVTEYNVREKIVELLAFMKSVNTILRVKSTTQENVELVIMDTQLEDEKFSKHFK